MAVPFLVFTVNCTSFEEMWGMSSMYVCVHAHNCGIYSENFEINVTT